MQGQLQNFFKILVDYSKDLFQYAFHELVDKVWTFLWVSPISLLHDRLEMRVQINE